MSLRIIAHSDKFQLDILCKNDTECIKQLKKIKKWQDNFAEVEEITGSLTFCYRTRRYKRAITKIKTCTNNLKIEIIHL
jgi:hypothetical protein